MKAHLVKKFDRVKARARRLEESRDFEGAARVWEELICQHPDAPEAINELGIALVRAGRLQDGLAQFQRAMEVCPDLVAARTNAAVALRRLSRLPEALSQFHEVVELAPGDVTAYYNLGTTLHLAGRHEDAARTLKKALEVCPSHSPSALEMGKVLRKLDRNEEAVEAYRQAIATAPDGAEARLNLAGILIDAREFEDAIELLECAVKLYPNGCDGWLRLGDALRGVGRYTESIAVYRKALEINPSSVVGHCNMALTLMEMGRTEEAIRSCKKALAIDPASPIANFNLGTMLLRLGKFRDGWQAYNYRFAMHEENWFRDEAHAEPWTGETLTGKSILILGEQGYGDQIQFARYLPELTKLGAEVSFLVSKRLRRLFQTLDGPISVIEDIQPQSRFDFQCPLINLPGVFETLDLPIPRQTPYLAAEPERVAKWRSLIGDEGFRIGVVWQGMQHHSNDPRSYVLAALEPLGAVPGVRLISLQIDDGREQLQALSSGMRVEYLGTDFDSGEHGFLDSAAVMECIDLVVCCDTAIAHLAGALGRPVWIALRDAPDWRWQQSRSDSIWYPTATLFRQDMRGDWDAPFSRMADALKTQLQDCRDRASQQPTETG